MRDPGVVHQDVDLAQLRDRRLHAGFDLVFIADVQLEYRRLPAGICDLIRTASSFSSLRAASATAAPRFASSMASTADPLRCSGYQRNMALQL